MALSESVEYDKIEVVGIYKTLQIRKATVVKRDDTEIARSFERFSLQSGNLDVDGNYVENPLDKEPDGVTDISNEIKAVCNVVWTDEVKAAYKAFLLKNAAI
tara:strand:- start:60 stop:365 length:306 start_codon:yes stop_codon:yes gene_type:complete